MTRLEERGTSLASYAISGLESKALPHVTLQRISCANLHWDPQEEGHVRTEILLTF